MIYQEDRKEFEDTSKLEDNINEGIKKELRYQNMAILAMTSDKSVEYPINNLLYEYLDDILPATRIYDVVDPAERKRYYMRPDLFAYDKYGDIDLDWVILALNGVINHKDFTMTKIKIVDPEFLKPILANILSAEESYKIKNRISYKENARY